MSGLRKGRWRSGRSVGLLTLLGDELLKAPPLQPIDLLRVRNPARQRRRARRLANDARLVRVKVRVRVRIRVRARVRVRVVGLGLARRVANDTRLDPRA